MDRPLVFATSSYAYLEAELCHLGGFEMAELERSEFPDGERYQRLVTACQDRDVIVVGGTIHDRETLELYDLACASVYYGARRLTLVIPYFGYATMERAERPGEVVTAKTRARLLSSIPAASMGNRVYLLDLHAEAVTHYFEGATHPEHISARPIVERAARRLGGADFVLACTDAGRAKWVEGLANGLGVEAAFVSKRRVDGERTEVVGVSARVKGKTVVIYDDMIRTGSSLIGAAAAYQEAGAASIAAICTHGLFPGEALKNLERTGLLTAIVATDSHPRVLALRSEFLTVESIAPLLAARLGGELAP